MPVNIARLGTYLLPAVGLVAVVAALSILLPRQEEPDEDMVALSLYCAAEAKLAVEDIVDSFQRRAGVRVRVHFVPSHLLLNRIEGRSEGDLLLSADDLSMDRARRRGLVDEGRPVAYLVPVVMTGVKAHHLIQTVSDLMAPDIRLGLASGETTLGEITPTVLQKNGIPMERFTDTVAVSGTTAAELAQAVELGRIDAAILWRSWARHYRHQSRTIEIAAERNVIVPLVAAILSTSENADAARQFVKFLEGHLAQNTFRKYGYAWDDGSGLECFGAE